MTTLFSAADTDQLLGRLTALDPNSAPKWGKMTPSQMLCHCARALEVATGEHPVRQMFIGRILARFVRAGALGEKPFSRNSPTDPYFVVRDERDYSEQMGRLRELIQRFVGLGVEHAGQQTHSFFGRLTGDEWGRLMYKHIDHHLRQFGR